MFVAYDSADLPVTMTYPDGEAVTNSYNARMLLNTVTGSSPYVQSTAYYSAGRITSRALGNGLTQSSTYYPWNQQGGRLKILATGSLQNLTYTYDPNSNITQIVNGVAGETQGYGYDTLDRLTSWTLNNVLQRMRKI